MKKLILDFRLFFWSSSKLSRVILSAPLVLFSVIWIVVTAPFIAIAYLAETIPDLYKELLNDETAKSMVDLLRWKKRRATNEIP